MRTLDIRKRKETDLQDLRREIAMLRDELRIHQRLMLAELRRTTVAIRETAARIRTLM